MADILQFRPRKRDPNLSKSGVDTFCNRLRLFQAIDQNKVYSCNYCGSPTDECSPCTYCGKEK